MMKSWRWIYFFLLLFISYGLKLLEPPTCWTCNSKEEGKRPMSGNWNWKYWLKLCIAPVKPKRKYSLQGRCCSQPGQVLCSCGPGKFWLFSFTYQQCFEVKYFLTNLPLMQRSWTPGQWAVRPQKVGFYVSELIFLHPENLYTGAFELQRHKSTL